MHIAVQQHLGILLSQLLKFNKNMKKTLLTIGLVAITSVINAQSTNTPQSFYTTFTKYFTEFNPELTNTFGLNKVEVWTSVDSIQGSVDTESKLADALGIQYKFYDHLSVENVLRTSGIAGTILSDQVGVGFNLVVVDAELTVYADGGYNLEHNRVSKKFKDSVFGELGLRAKKALSLNTYAGVGLGVRVPDSTQVYQLIVGFSFK